MKKLITTLSLCVLCAFACNYGFAQTFPYGINYQAVARDANGNAKQYPGGVPLRFTIFKTSSSGTLIWQETQTSPPTNTMGQFNVIIGNGVRQPASTVANFSNINWSNDNYFLMVEIQTGISTFVQIGATTQFQSVPYALAAPDNTPAGAIIAFGGVSAPSGYVMCKGQAVSRAGIYAKLFATIGTAYGNGDGSTTFNVPDFRGMFLRGTDSTAINDPDAATRTAVSGGNSGAKLGSKEADNFASHSHYMPGGAQTNGSAGIAVGPQTAWGIYTSPAGGSETRPKNVYVNYIIKY